MAKHALFALKSIVGMAFPFIFLIIITICLCIEGCSLEEREALLQFKATLNDSNRHLSSWKGEDCCNWRGVDCYGKPRHVVKLDLHGLKLSNLSSHIDSSLFQLKYLRHLDLSDNEFYRMQLPLELGMLKALTYLDISYAGFEGDVPSELGNLSSLRYLDLSSSLYYYPSSMHSSGLEWVGSMSSLNYLSLDFMNLSTISTQSWGNAIGSLSKLTHLGLFYCSLSSIPLSLLNLSSLAFLDLSYNSFTSGHVPSWLGNMSSLTSLDLSGNEFTGEIADNLSHLRFLTHLDLRYNLLNGTIPSSLANLSALQYLYLAGNHLQGGIPYSFGKLSSLTHLDLSNNQISGTLPPSLALLSSLGMLDLSSNSMLGVISETLLENLTKLSVLDLSGSGLAVNISSAWIPSFQLQFLEMRSCKMNGSFPTWIVTQDWLRFLDLSDNNLVGRIPSWIWDISSELFHLNLSRNHLEGPLISNRMSELDVSFNKLSGSLPLHFGIPEHFGKVPKQFGRLQYLQSLRIQDNKLNGSLPSSITNCSQLQVLDLRNNAFTGTIPSWIGNFSQLQVLIMKFNTFEGRIPLEIGRLSQLRVLDISSNYISGTIPKSILNLTSMTTPLQDGVVLEESFFVGSGDLDGTGYSAYYRESLELTTKGEDLIYPYILSTLTCIDLSKNLLTGHVPAGTGKLKGKNSVGAGVSKFHGNFKSIQQPTFGKDPTRRPYAYI
eukprot:Gb_05285 [translate_table: standard]